MESISALIVQTTNGLYAAAGGEGNGPWCSGKEAHHMPRMSTLPVTPSAGLALHVPRGSIEPGFHNAPAIEGHLISGYMRRIDESAHPVAEFAYLEHS